jgi:hypothetical protein
VSDLSQPKLKKLIEIEGYNDDTDLIADAVADSVCPAICMNDGCDYTTGMEPDQDRGWCESCATNSMKSALVLAGLRRTPAEHTITPRRQITSITTAQPAAPSGVQNSDPP